MSARVTLQHVRDAHAARDPRLVELLERLLEQPLETQEPPPREGAYTFDRFLEETRDRKFRRQPLDEQAQWRMQKLNALAAPDAEVPLADPLRAHEILMELWEAGDDFSRNCLLALIRKIPLVYGPFKALKQIFKASEARDDTEVLGALAARFDMAFATNQHQVSQRTLGYLCRRAWRYLRRVGQTLPACYADVATDFLIHYTPEGEAHQESYGSWIFNHIFFHKTGEYTATRFKFDRHASAKSGRRRPNDWLKHRAYAELWRRTPRPLFTLLEKASSELVRKYATQALTSEFRAALREVEPQWVARLAGTGSATIDQFVVWILDNVPKFEQGAFRDLGLHEAVLRLFDSPSSPAQKYAASYARTHARDLPVTQLIRLANSAHPDVRKLAIDLLRSRDPRKEIGLEAWGELLETPHGNSVAADVLRKHFGARELTPEWFAERLLASREGRQFVEQRLVELHPPKKLGWEYFTELAERLDPENELHDYAAHFITQQLAKLDVNEIAAESLRRLLLHPLTRYAVQDWVEQGKLKPQLLEVDYLKRLAFHPSWVGDPWIAELKQTRWGRDHLEFDEQLSGAILSWLRDVRLFTPDQLGFDWLMQLVNRAEARYHDFAVETMIKAFLPADFAPSDATDQEPAEKASPDDEIKVDLQGASFVFTGKLATMTRGVAQGKVTAAGGANASTVNKKLDYLVIGDEGSPLYGEGRKGSKQVKGEKLNEDGAGIRIISETAFLQMLAGEQREFSEDVVEAGCMRLWDMMCEAPDPEAPLARFARTYLRQHHPDICLAETDRPVDPGAEIPPEFLTFERVQPLFSDRRTVLREFALEMARWEFARWSPPIEGLIACCESPYPEVRQFVATAMTAEDAPHHRRYRVDPAVLTPDAVYRFCESGNAETRALGMQLIEAHPRLKVPEELFRLTESPDAKVRAFVIRAFWSLYRQRGISDDWKPRPPQETSKAKKKKQDVPLEERIGRGAPSRPEQLPADGDQLQSLLRRILFEVPPGRPPISDDSDSEPAVKLPPLPARMAKLRLIETLRDLALEDREFALRMLPLLREFMLSRGKSEQAACLVAVTRIQHTHVDLPTDAPADS